MKPPVLAVAGLQKKIRGRTLVKDISFEVYPGEVFGFLGPNGAGKTTTIRMLVGLIRPSSGKIFIDGQNLRTQTAKALKRIGSIVESPDLYPFLTGYENLLQLARMQGDEAISRIGEVAEQVALTDRLHDPVKTYSLGMRQRLGIAQALLPNPKLLILDEPTNGLDPAGIHELRRFLRDLAKQGIGIFISSHLLTEVEQLCDSVAMLRDGRIIRSGRVEELLREQADRVVWRVAPIPSACEILRRYAEQAEVVGDQIVCSMEETAVAAAASALAAANCSLYEVSRRRWTLEDVFLQTTGGNP